MQRLEHEIGMAFIMLRSATLIMGWFALIWASLQLHHIDLGHAICGPWGCGPPASALLSIHLFWLVTIVPPILWAVRDSPPRQRLVSRFAIAAGLIGLLTIGIYDFCQFPEIYESGHAWQRFLFRLATLADLPVVQVLILGLLVKIQSLIDR